MKKRGSIVLEALIMIMLLVGMFYVIMSYALLARTEVLIQNSLNQSVKEFSQYTYLLGSMKSNELTEAEEKISLVQSSIENLANKGNTAIDSVGDGTMTIENVAPTIKDLVASGKEVKDNAVGLVEYLSDPKTFLTVVIQIVKQEALKTLAPVVVEHIFKDGLSRNKIDLSEKGVLGNVEFLSAEYDSTTKMLTFEIKYKTKGMFYDLFKQNEKEVIQKSTIRIWSGEEERETNPQLAN